MTEEKNPFGGDFKEATGGSFVRWGSPVEGKEDGSVYIALGESIKGILTDVEERENRLQPGTMQKIYTIQLEDGSEVKIGSRGKAFDSQLKTVLKGQHVGFWYKEDIPSKKKGYNAFKNVCVYVGELDEDYEAAKGVDADEEPKDVADVPFE